MRRWHLTEHVSYLRDISPCSVHCHETMTTDWAWFIPQGYITMLCPLSWDDGNWRSMFHTCMLYYHALTVVMIQDNWRNMIHTVGYIKMLWPLSLDDDNWMSMCHTLGMNNHALSVVRRRWQLTKHVSYMTDILPCSERCLETMTTDGACFIPLGWTIILWPLSLDDDRWRAWFIH